MQRVVITGIGVISPVGSRIETFWDSIRAGRHGISPIENIDMTGQKITLAAQVKDFHAEDYIEKREARQNGSARSLLSRRRSSPCRIAAPILKTWILTASA